MRNITYLMNLCSENQYNFYNKLIDKEKRHCAESRAIIYSGFRGYLPVILNEYSTSINYGEPVGLISVNLIPYPLVGSRKKYNFSVSCFSPDDLDIGVCYDIAEIHQAYTTCLKIFEYVKNRVRTNVDYKDFIFDIYQKFGGNLEGIGETYAAM